MCGVAQDKDFGGRTNPRFQWCTVHQWPFDGFIDDMDDLGNPELRQTCQPTMLAFEGKAICM